MGIFYDNTLTAFVIVTLVLGGGAAWLTGRAVALSWQPALRVVLYMLLLALPVRFLHWSLADGTLLALQYYIVDAVVLIGISLLSHRLYQTSNMVNQYPWLYERKTLLSWGRKQ